jgi:nucleotide-binding universal stress UspA family protein
MIEHVVVPLDGSDLAARALRPARALAEATGASLRLMTTHWEDGEGGATRYLQDQAERLEFASVEALVIRDRPPEEAILLEGHRDHSVVCMATHGRGGIRQATLGSIAEAVVRASHAPVLLVGPHVDPAWAIGPGELLVPYDGSTTSGSVAPVATEWAHVLHLQLRAVQVLPAGKGIVERPHEVESAELRRFAARLQPGAAPARWEVLRALDPAAALVAEEARVPATLVAMATHGRTGLGRVALGSVATRVVHDSRCPVLVIRPAEHARRLQRRGSTDVKR